jgi:radical SAM superfamily enzyme YgiQ (UPF0313 family)
MSLLYAMAPLYDEISRGTIADTEAKDVIVAQPNSIAEIVTAVVEHRADLLGLSVTTYSARFARDAARKIKEVSPHTQIILGGAHFDGLAKQCRGDVSRLAGYIDESCDVVLAGEAEHALTALVRRAAQHADGSVVRVLDADVEAIASAPGRFSIWWRTAGELRIVSGTGGAPTMAGNGVARSVTLPRHLLAESCERQFSIFTDENGRPRRTAQVLTYRGCLFAVNPKNACSFCFVANRYTPGVIEHTLEELRQLRADGYDAVFFDDAVFTSRSSKRKGELRRIAEVLGELEFPALGFQTRADYLDSEVLGILRNAGPSRWYCSLGLESTDESILAVVGKKQSIQQVSHSLGLLRDFDFDVGLYLLFGALGRPEKGCYTLETLDTARGTIDFVARHADEGVRIVSALPGLSMILPGTQDALRYETSWVNAERPLRFETVHEGKPWSDFEGGLGMHAPGVTAELAESIEGHGRNRLGNLWT